MCLTQVLLLQVLSQSLGLCVAQVELPQQLLWVHNVIWVSSHKTDWIPLPTC